MQRDRALIGRILDYASCGLKPGGGEHLRCPTFEDVDHATVVEHVKLCSEMGYLEISRQGLSNRPDFVLIKRITAQGYDALETYRDSGTV